MTVTTPSRRDYLHRLLVPFWLRPESALWYAHEAFLARRYLGDALSSPSLELGCMEGTSTFVLLGGEFGPHFDVYSEVNWSRDSIHWNSLKDDYYNVSRQKEDASIDIRTRPSLQFDYGLSWKKAHLEKAERLGIHRQLLEHDPNAPLTMFDDNSLALIWAPNLYWIDNLDGLVHEFHRVLQSGGRVVTVLPDRRALDFMLYNYAEQTDPDWIRNLDRGRYGNIARQARSLDEWQAFFETHRFQITRHDGYLPRLVLQTSDIGFRPLFPVLMDIYETLQKHSREDWLRIKEHWIETVEYFLAPLCEGDWLSTLGGETVWHIFELKPRAE